MNIRPFSDADYPAILDIYNRSKLDEFRFENKNFELLTLENDENRLSELLDSDIYVCELENVVGFGAIFELEIRALFVCPNARRLGVGKSLLEVLLSKIVGSSNLYVVRSNVLAKQLYFDYGYTIGREILAE